MKKIFLIEKNVATANFGFFIALFLPIIGPLLYLLLFGSKYDHITKKCNKIAFNCLIFHIKLIVIFVGLVAVYLI